MLKQPGQLIRRGASPRFQSPMIDNAAGFVNTNRSDQWRRKLISRGHRSASAAGFALGELPSSWLGDEPPCTGS